MQLGFSLLFAFFLLVWELFYTHLHKFSKKYHSLQKMYCNFVRIFKQIFWIKRNLSSTIPLKRVLNSLYEWKKKSAIRNMRALFQSRKSDRNYCYSERPNRLFSGSAEPNQNRNYLTEPEHRTRTEPSTIISPHKNRFLFPIYCFSVIKNHIRPIFP